MSAGCRRRRGPSCTCRGRGAINGEHAFERLEQAIRGANDVLAHLGGRHDPERPLRADEQAQEVVARHVLADGTAHLDRLAGRDDRLESGDPVTGRVRGARADVVRLRAQFGGE
jgi:hypothetical protein